MNEFMTAWKIDEKGFPQNGSDEEKLAFCLNYAILAPSTYNVQPWCFKIEGSTAYIYFDRRYALPVIDPDDRELGLSCAAALFNLCLALNYFGYKAVTELLPDPADKDLLARVRIGDLAECDEAQKALFKAIPKRHTNRGAFADKEVPAEMLRILRNEASKEGAWLHVCTPDERRSIVQMVVEADHMQTASKHFRRELASWVNPRRALSGDGMPDIGLTHAQVMNSLTPSLARRFEVENHQLATDAQLDAGSPVIAVLGTHAGGLLERIHAGQAMMRIFLQAEVLGLSVSTLNQPCEVPELRLRLHDEIKQQGRVHMIFRIGFGSKPSYTPRRPLSSVLLWESKSAKLSGTVANDTAAGGFFKKVMGLFGRRKAAPCP